MIRDFFSDNFLYPMLLGVLAVLLALQAFWAFDQAKQAAKYFETILANQNRIMEEYGIVIELDERRVAQNAQSKEALDTLAKNDKMIVEKCLNELEEHVRDTQKGK